MSKDTVDGERIRRTETLRRRPGPGLASVILLAGLACSDAGSGPTIPPDEVVPEPELPRAVACDGDTVAPVPMSRLGATAYERALRSLLGDEAIDAIAPIMAIYRPVAIGPYDSHLGPASAAEVEAQLEIGSAAAMAVMARPSARARVLPCLVDIETKDDSSVKACAHALAEHLGARALRRTLQPEDLERFLSGQTIGAADGVVDGFVTLMSTILIDPEFHYFMEFGTNDGQSRLSSGEAAARLARILWDDLPDEQLMAAAAANFVAPDWDAEVDRVWAEPRTRQALARFAHDWLALDDMPLPLSAWSPTSDGRIALRLAAIREVQTFFTDSVVDRGGTYADLLLDPTARIANPELASIYGVVADANNPVMLPREKGRAGLLTRVGWLATPAIPGTNAGHLVRRGEHLSRFLCDEIPPPNPNVVGVIQPLNTRETPEESLRDRFARLTGEAPCKGCHATLEAHGAPFGHHGAMGEWIDREQNRVTGSAPREVEITTAAQVDIDGERVSVDSAPALSEQIARSSAGPRCLVEQIVQRLYGRELQPSDRCLVDRLTQTLSPADGGEPGSIENLVKLALKSPEFWHRAAVTMEAP